MTKTKNKKMKLKSGTGPYTSKLWVAIFSQAGQRLGDDLNKRLKASVQVVTETLEEKNNETGAENFHQTS